MEATEHGLSNLITSLSKKDREKLWKAIYLINTCLFTYGRDLSSCVIQIMHMDRLRGLSLDLSKRNRAVPAVCIIVAL